MTQIDIFSIAMAALTIKHFIADFPLQTTWMALNKGTFLHPGGLLHAGIHAFASALVLLPLQPWLNVTTGSILLLVLAEAIFHYVIDFTKMNVDARYKWSELVYDDNCNLKGRLITSPTYYISLGFDQFLHGITYVGMTWWVFH